jgi:hypothetical protein
VETRHNLGNALYQSFEVVLELQVSNRLQDDELKTTFEGILPRQVNATICSQQYHQTSKISQMNQFQVMFEGLSSTWYFNTNKEIWNTSA